MPETHADHQPGAQLEGDTTIQQQGSAATAILKQLCAQIQPHHWGLSTRANATVGEEEGDGKTTPACVCVGGGGKKGYQH